MTEPTVPSDADEKDGCLVVGCALAFWLLIPFPFWLLGMGFAGQLVLWPDNWEPISVIWAVAFYAPLALIAFVVVDSFRSRSGNRGED